MSKRSGKSGNTGNTGNTGNKRGNNEGSIRYRADRSLYEARYTAPDGKRHSLYGKTRQEASRKLTEALRNLARGLPVAPERLTLAAYLTGWLETHKVETRESSWRRYEELCRLHIIPALGRIPLQQLTPHDLNRLYADRLKAGLSTTTVHYLHRTLHKALHDAQRADLIARNVAELDSPPRKAEYTPQTFTVEQARAFLAAIRDDRFYALYILAVMTGMREGELLALTWEMVDLDAGTLAVRATHRRMAGRFVVNQPKTAAGRRPLALPPIAVLALRQHRTRQHAERLQLGAAWSENEDVALVFPNRVGRRIAGDAFYHSYYLPILRRAGLPTIRFHDLRHTFGTLLLLLGVDPKIVSEMLGHSSVTITQNLYQHVMPEMQRDASNALERLLFPDAQ